MKLSALTWGIPIYAIVFLAWQGLVIWGFSSGIAPHLIELLVLVVVSICAGRALRRHSWWDVLPYSIVWALTAVILDAVYIVPFGGWQIYADWNIWFGYCLVAIAPLFSVLGTRLA